MPKSGRKCSEILNIGFQVSPDFLQKNAGLRPLYHRYGMPVTRLGVVSAMFRPTPLQKSAA